MNEEYSSTILRVVELLSIYNLNNDKANRVAPAGILLGGGDRNPPGYKRGRREKFDKNEENFEVCCCRRAPRSLRICLKV